MFDDVGFAALPQLLDDSELPAARDQIEAVTRRPLPAGCVRPHNTLVPLRWSDDLVLGALRSPRMTKAIAGAVSATDLRWTSGYVSVKEPQSPPLWWHQDWWCWHHPASFERRATQIAVLCYVDATDQRSGALRLLPGSHRRSVALHAALPTAPMETELDLEHAAMSNHPDQRTFDAVPGDAVAIDYRLLHGTHPNDAARRRCCVILNFAPHWDGLPDDIKAHLIQHPALPSAAEAPAADVAAVLPQFTGEPRDLPLLRDAPARFAIT